MIRVRPDERNHLTGHDGGNSALNKVRASATGAIVQAGDIHGGVWFGSAPPPSVPRQLPLPDSRLVGREEQLAWLSRTLQHGGIALLTGTPGVGKTALAVRWASDAVAEFPDGQLFVDLRGHGPHSPISPSGALATFLRALGHDRPERMRGVEERSAAFRTATSGSRMIIILDNAASTDQVLPLLPGSGGCAVLVTSRSALPAFPVHHPVEILTVPRLSEADGAALLAASPSNPHVRDLARRCAGLPLALRIVGSRLARRSASELVGRGGTLQVMDVGEGPRAALRPVFSWSYSRLSETEAATFQTIGLHPGPADAHVVAAVLETDLTTASDLLDTLMNGHLIEETAAGWFTTHDLLRDYVVEQAGANRDAILERMFAYYLAAADQADDLVTPRRYRPSLPSAAPVLPTISDQRAASAWLDRVLPTITALCGLDDPRVDGARWRLAFAVRGFFYLSKRLDAWIDTHTNALGAALRAGDTYAEALTRNNLGMALVESGCLAEAAAHYAAAELLFTRMGDHIGQANSILNSASVLRRQGRLEGALDRQREALACYRASSQSRNAGIALRAMARVESRLGMHAEAVSHADEALDIAVALELHLDAAQAAASLAEAHSAGGEQIGAEIASHLALRYSRLAGSAHEEATAHCRLAELARASGDLSSAADRYRVALTLFRDIGSPDAAAVADSLRSMTAPEERSEPDRDD